MFSYPVGHRDNTRPDCQTLNKRCPMTRVGVGLKVAYLPILPYLTFSHISSRVEIPIFNMKCLLCWCDAWVKLQYCIQDQVGKDGARWIWLKVNKHWTGMHGKHFRGMGSSPSPIQSSYLESQSGRKYCLDILRSRRRRRNRIPNWISVRLIRCSLG